MQTQHVGHTTHDHFFHYGDVYDTIDACHALSRMLGRLQRQHLLDEDAVTQSKAQVAEILARLEGRLPLAS
jgi:uncharacterized protein YjaG (DUF416 family)